MSYPLSPALAVFFFISLSTSAQSTESQNRVTFTPGDAEADKIRKAAHIRPSPRQVTWQQYEVTGFVHFGMNTFTNREWGEGTEDPQLFNPTQLDARQWVRTAKAFGMTELILTTKHHDGFCLWPTKTTKHSVVSSPWKGGKGDVVADVAAACREYGLKFGVYLSPWDRNQAKYGIYGTDQYNDFFKTQLRELLTNYGPIAEVWFDGANGEGKTGKKQVYDWNSYYNLVRELQPNAVVSISGPDVRWVGNEAGEGRDTEWSVVPLRASEQDVIAANSQQVAGSGVFVPSGDRMDIDLGSRAKILEAKTLIWYPSVVNNSFRPGWFYHPEEDTKQRSVDKLVGNYYQSVGKNSVWLLNFSPDKRGLIHENDVKILREGRAVLAKTFCAGLHRRCHHHGYERSQNVRPESRTRSQQPNLLDHARHRHDWLARTPLDNSPTNRSGVVAGEFSQRAARRIVRNRKFHRECLAGNWPGNDHWLQAHFAVPSRNHRPTARPNFAKPNKSRNCVF